MSDLDKLREKIDSLDMELINLINERARTTIEIGNAKRALGEPIYAPARERAVYKKVEDRNKGPLSQVCFQAIYREIMSGTIALQGGQRVAYLGPQGTYSHMAANAKFGHSMQFVACRDIREVFLSVERGEADSGVVPVENAIEGSIGATADMLLSTNLKICAEILMPIRNKLMAKCEKEKITTVLSHPQPLGQCRAWLSTNMPNAIIQEVASTALAAQRAAVEENVACIASTMASEIYKLNIIAGNIEDCQDNITRFVVLGQKASQKTGNDKTSVCFAVAHASGSLCQVLEIFESHKVNLTKIESRPTRRKAWEYAFFVDVEGHKDDASLVNAFEALSAKTRFFEVLGSYPKSSEVGK